MEDFMEVTGFNETKIQVLKGYFNKRDDIAFSFLEDRE
jgi:hypothetical protein